VGIGTETDTIAVAAFTRSSLDLLSLPPQVGSGETLRKHFGCGSSGAKGGQEFLQIGDGEVEG